MIAKSTMRTIQHIFIESRAARLLLHNNINSALVSYSVSDLILDKKTVSICHHYNIILL